MILSLQKISHHGVMFFNSNKIFEVNRKLPFHFLYGIEVLY
jgi:hypothetical protein